MKMLVVTIRCYKASVGEFKIAIDPHLETIVDQLPFERRTPVDPFTGKPLPEEIIVHHMGGYPMQADISVEEALDLIQYFKPDEKVEITFPGIVETMNTAMRASLEAVRSRPGVTVELKMFPCFSSL